MNQPAIDDTAPKVTAFDHLIMWPLLLHDTRPVAERTLQPGSDKRSRTEFTLDAWDTEICRTGSRWERRPYSERADYREMLYFHPFVRNFLYDQYASWDGADPPEPVVKGVRIYDRKDVEAVRLTLSAGETVDLYVQRVSLYLFDTLVAILVVEISNEWRPANVDPNPCNRTDEKELFPATDLRFDQVLQIQEGFRRIYPPFWFGEKGTPPVPGVSLPDVQWLQIRNDPRELIALSSERAASDFADVGKFTEFVQQTTESPVGRHWQYLMEPLIPFRGKLWKYEYDRQGDESWLSYQQIEDERAPVMSYIAVDEPERLTDSEWSRLTFLDSAADHSDRKAYPYAADFMRGWKQEHTYGRFWGAARSADENPDEGDQYSTRYLCCGYAFVVVGKSNDWFFTDTEFIRHHFRAHYFKLGLIAQFHRASFLMFADQLADATYLHERGNNRLFRFELERIQSDLLTFRSRFWFTEVSNHVQGRELFHFWSKHLGTRELFEQVMDELRTMVGVISQQEQDEISRIGERFTVVATIGLGLSVFLGLVGLFKDANTEFALDGRPLPWVWFTAMGVLGGTFGVLRLADYLRAKFRQLFKWSVDDHLREEERYRRISKLNDE